jgi:uncharacterized delta-60 repeat protein
LQSQLARIWGTGSRPTPRKRRSTCALGVELLEDRRLLSAGALDPGFGSGGKLITDVPGSTDDYSRNVVVSQPDHKIVVLGFVANYPSENVLARYNPDGSLDTTFGSGGLVTLDQATLGILVNLTVDGAGRILAAGYSPTYDFTVFRFNADGSADMTFGQGGKVVTDLGGSDFGASVALDSASRILVAGNTNGRMALVRYTSDGSLDASFGGGIVITRLNSFAVFAGGVAVGSDGRIFVAGTATHGSTKAFGLAAYNPDGSLDTSFGPNHDGIATAAFGSVDDEAYQLALDSVGRIVVAGTTERFDSVGFNYYLDFAVARFNPDGNLDTSFGANHDGKAITHLTENFNVPSGLAIDAGDSVVLTTSTYRGSPTYNDIVTLRYTAGGVLDTTFGLGGIVYSDFGFTDFAGGVAIDGSHILVVGNILGNTTGEDFALLRFNADGSPDTTFGHNGVATTDIPGASDNFAQGVVVTQPDGKVLVAGTSYDVTARVTLARYNADGTPDTSFGAGGVVNLGFGASGYGTLAGVAVTSSGQIIVAGTGFRSIDHDFAVARLNADGSLDTTFGQNGIAFADFGAEDTAVGVAIDSNGRIVVAGYTLHPGEGLPRFDTLDFAVARFNADGSLDANFGNGGKVTSGLGSDYDSAVGVAIDGSGRIVVAGNTFPNYQPEEVVVRYNADGSRDTTFGPNQDGMAAVANFGYAASAVIDRSGRIIVGGTGGTFGDDFALVAFTPSGNLDTTFGPSHDGTAVTDFAGSYDWIASLAIDPAGRIVAAGGSDQGSPNGNDFAVARYNPDGSLDTSFGSGGKITTDFGFSDDGVNGVTTDPLGRIVAAGYTGQAARGTGYDFAVARYDGGALAFAVNPATIAADLQRVVSGLDASTATTLSPVVLAVDSSNFFPALYAVHALNVNPAGPTITIILNVSSGIYSGVSVSVPAGVRLVLNGSAGQVVFQGHSPALTVDAGDVLVENGVTITNNTDAPTIRVTGGSLTLRNDVIQESTGYSQAAISITGGTVDLGTVDDPGGDTFTVNSAGTFFRNTTASRFTAVGDTFERDGQVTTWQAPLAVTANSSLMLVGNSPPPLTGSVNGAPFTGTITYTTAYGDPVTVTLATTATAGSPVGQYAITASLFGASADDYVIDPATSQFGTVYVVSLDADPTSSTGAQSVAFWDSKGNSRLITAADLSSLDAVNLVTQGGAAFDPKSVQQLQAWLSTSPNATAAYQLAVQLAVLDLNVLTGYVKATDLVYAGQLQAYASADGIAGLTPGGFINVRSLMNAANEVLSRVRPGTPSGDPNQADEAALAQILQAVNGNTDFVKQEVLWNLSAIDQAFLLAA